MRNEGNVPPQDAVQANARKRSWFPKEESVAIGILGYICEADGKYTIEDIIIQIGCNAASAGGALWQLKHVGYVEQRKASHRIAMKNPKWGRNKLFATARGKARYARHLTEMQKHDEKEVLR